MKTTSSHRRTSLRAIRPRRVHAPGRTGNGHAVLPKNGVDIRADVAAWLARPKHNLIDGKWAGQSSRGYQSGRHGCSPRLRLRSLAAHDTKRARQAPLARG